MRVPLLLLMLGGVAALGCVRHPIVSTDSLPLKRVVVYRNGIAYFERAGHVDQSEVRFKMKEGEVGDFLATLAVMERGGSSVRAAAFPLKMDDENQDAKPRSLMSEDEKKGLKVVVLSLDGKEHDLHVGYVAESPVWRPSYRLVVQPSGQADLQAWGIVENLSGEDWKDIRLSLVSGAPLAFEAQLGLPVIPPRPTVTDSGEVIAAVPRAETSLRQEAAPEAPPPPPTPAPAPVVAADQDEEDGPEKKEARRDKKVAVGGGGKGAAAASRARAPKPKTSAVSEPTFGPGAPPSASAAEARLIPSQPRDLRSLAAVAVEGGTTRYELPAAVTVPDKSATMVLLLSRRVPGEAIFLFAPDGGVPDSSSHPFRVARFANRTGGVLEKGPIAVFDGGSFLGQGMLDPLPDGATTTVPFALERALAVDQDRKYDELGERVAKIENGELTIERDSVTLTKYRARNGGDQPAKLLVKHARLSGTRLFNPPKETEDNVGTHSALVPVNVGAHATTELVVDERATLRRSQDWFSVIADNAVKAWLADPRADRALVARLGAAWATRNQIVAKNDVRDKLAQEQSNLGQQTEETRRNLRAIEKNAAADALRRRLTQRLGETAARLDEITKQLVEVDAKLAELRVQFKESIRDVKVTEPLPPRP
jgi:hypothetical protein